jgi:hypothetical protein
MDIRLSVKISEENYIEISKELYKSKMKYGWGFITFIFIISLMMFIEIASEIEKGINFEEHKIEIIWFLVIIFWYLGMPQLRIRNYRKIYRENKNINNSINYSIDSEFIEAKTSLSESKTSWKAIIQVQEITDWFLLRPNTVSFHALPKNQLNPSQQAWLRHKVIKN